MLLLEGSDLPREPQLSDPGLTWSSWLQNGLSFPCPQLAELWEAGRGVVLGLYVQSGGPGRL